MYITSKKACETIQVHPNTLRRWDANNQIDVIRTPSGQRLYLTSLENKKMIKNSKIDFIYARVSSISQKSDLESQNNLLKLHFPIHHVIKDIGSGLNYKRKGFKSILDACLSKTIGQVVVTHKDRLCRFGFDMLEYLICSSGGTILVLNQTTETPEEEMVQDITSIMHVFSCRLYGLRKYKKQIKESNIKKT
jgi:putative resolvase